jgi:DMSO/TMAO reductase YedYZ heme-binding membrane subunit
MLHYLTFVVYGLALAHGVLNGTDSTSAIVRGTYWLSAAVVMFFLFYRLLATRRPLAGAVSVRAALR